MSKVFYTITFSDTHLWASSDFTDKNIVGVISPATPVLSLSEAVKGFRKVVTVTGLIGWVSTLSLTTERP